MKLGDCRVSVIGLGLMGGSLAAALKGHVRMMTGMDHSSQAVERAVAQKLVDVATLDMEQALDSCDLAVLAVPVRSILGIIARLGRDLPAPDRLMDLGSTKVEVVRAMAGLPPSVDPIGGHPLCGREIGGAGSADGRLFRGARFALVPLERTSPELRSLAEELITVCGGEPLFMGAENHDRAVALTSHVPYLLAAALVDRVKGRLDEVRNVLASGFHDTSRLAASDVTMMMDILMTNREFILEELNHLEELSDRLRADLEEGREARLRSKLDQIRRTKLSLNSRKDQVREPDGNWPGA